MKEDMTDREICIVIGQIGGESPITVKDIGWSEEEKERMRQAGYDSLDMIRAWYS